MKKVVLAGVGIIALASLIAPKFVGSSVNTKLQSIISKLDENPAYSASIKEQQTSWFSTKAIIQIGIDPVVFSQEQDAATQDAFADMNIDIEFNAQHGPILTKNGFSIGWLNWKAKIDGDSVREKIEFDANSPIYQIVSSTNLFGQSEMFDEIPSFKLIDNSAFSQLSFSGWKGHAKYSNALTSYKGSSASFVVESALGDVEITSLTMATDMETDFIQALDGGFYDSTVSMQIQGINYVSALTQETAVMNELELNGTSELDEQNSQLDSKINFLLAELTTADLNLKDLVINSEINNLQEKFFKAYQTLMEEVGKEPEKMQDKLKAFIKSDLLGQLQAEPEINITSLTGKLNDGSFSGSVNSKIQQISTLPETLEDISFWLQHLKLDAALNADKSVALWLAANTMETQLKSNPQTAEMTEQAIKDLAQQQAPNMLQGMQQQGMFTETAEGYEVKLTIDAGKASLNGNPMPLPGTQ